MSENTVIPQTTAAPSRGGTAQQLWASDKDSFFPFAEWQVETGSGCNNLGLVATNSVWMPTGDTGAGDWWWEEDSDKAGGPF